MEFHTRLDRRGGVNMAALRTDARGVVVTCGSCGQANRLAFDTLGEHTRCGRCQADVPAPGAPVDVREAADFDAMIRASRLPVLVDFWAAWCGPCRAVATEIARVAERHRGEWLVAKVDTDALQEVAARLQIQSIPTLAVFRRGAVAGRTAGAMSAPQIEAFVRQSLEQAG